jgi:cobalt-zinc-cadmium efflux system outer membrane protein
MHLAEQIRRGLCALFISLAPVSLLMAQGPPSVSTPPRSPQASAAPSRAGTPLDDLLKELETNNPQLRAAEQAWDAAKLSPAQASGLADAQLRDLARAQADVAQQNYETVRRSLRADLKEAYLQLSSIFDSLQTLNLDSQLLARIEQAAEVRYRSGMGNQQELLRAQLEQTKHLAEISHHDLEAAKIQYRIKQLLNRSPSFSDVIPASSSETNLEQSYFDLFATARSQNPEIAGAERAVASQQLRVDLARKDLEPDFSVQYEWQLTDSTLLRAYYMLEPAPRPSVSKGVKELPAKEQPALAQAETELLRSRSELDTASLAVADELGDQYATAQRTKDLLRIYREGLLPQARTLVESGLAAYQDNRLDFSEVLSASLEISRLNSEYWQVLADHETAIARIEEITGLSLRSSESAPATP